MSSIFDGLTVAAPGVGAGGPGSIENPSVATLPRLMPAVDSSTDSPAVGSVSSSAQMVCTGPTGLIARIESGEFTRLVSQAGPILVLYTPGAKGSQRLGNDRYVASVAGTVFIAHASSALRFASNVTVVPASAVLCNGRPLSNEDFV